MSTIIQCDGTWSVDASGLVSCAGSASLIDLSEYYLLPASAERQAALFLNGGFDAEAAGTGFAAVVILFSVGLGVGLIVQMTRRLR